MSKLSRLDDTIQNQGGSQARPQSKEEHSTAFITAQRLHCRVINKFDGATKCGLEIKPKPPGAKVVWFRCDPPSDYGTWIADGNTVILPFSRKLFNPGHHPGWSQRRPRRKFARSLLPGNKDLHVRSTNVNDKDIHRPPFFRSWKRPP